MGIGINKKLKPFATEKYRYKVAYGGRNSTKSWGVARILLLLASSKPMRILCTREIQNSIKESVHKLLKDQIDLLKLQGWNIQSDSISHANGSEFIFKGLYTNIEKIKSLEAVDVCWIEEAETISQDSWDILDPTIRKEGSEIWITFNPRLEEDTVYTKFILNNTPNSLVVHLNYTDNTHITKDVLEQIEDMQKNDYDKFKHIYLGECKKIGDKKIFSIQELNQAIIRPRDDFGEHIWGLDVARFGDDRSVLAKRQNNYIGQLERWQGLSTTELTNRVHAIYNAEEKKPDAIVVDTIGVGAGVADQLAVRGLPVVEGNSAMKADDPNYVNKRAEMYMELKKRMKVLTLPNVQDLVRELLQLEYLYTNSGKIQIVSKDIIKKNYGKSPDLADAVALTFFAKFYTSVTEDWRGGW